MPPPASPATLALPLRRRDRAIALVIDLAWGAGALALTSLLAFLWLFIRTEWGRYDVTDGDSIVAAALIGGAVPAWLARLAVGIAWDRATPGQRLRRITIEVEHPNRPIPRALRFLLHPVAVAGWFWLTIAVWLTTIPLVPLLPALITGMILIMGLISTVLILTDGSARALHDRLAGTRLVRSEEGER